jgi:hypothetical protein
MSRVHGHRFADEERTEAEQYESDVHGSVHLGNVYVRLKVQLDVHGFMYS